MAGEIDLAKGPLADEAAELVVAHSLEVCVIELVEQLLVGACKLLFPLGGGACRLHSLVGLPPFDASAAGGIAGWLVGW